MKRIIIILLVVTAVVAAVLVTYTYTRRAPQAADLLPESTLVFLDIPDLSKARADFSKTELYALWHEPEVQAFLAKPLAALHETIVNYGAPKESAVMDEILDAAQGEVFLALTKINILPTPSPALVLGVDTRHRRLEVAAAMHELQKRLKSSDPAIHITESKFLGVNYAMWEARPGISICQASLDSLFVLTVGEDTMRDLIACYAGQTPRNFTRLSASSKYRDVLQHTSRNKDFLAYVNVQEILSLAGPFLALAPQTAGLYQKVSRLQTSAASMTFVNGGIEDIGLVSYSSDAPDVAPPVQRKTLALTTPETLVYWTSSLNLPALYDQTMQSLSQAGNANIMAGVGFFQQMLNNNGVRIREDLLQKIGPECALLLNWRPGTRAPDCAFVAEISSTNGILSALDGTMNALNSATLGDQSSWDDTEFAGQRLRTVHTKTNLAAPTYAATDKFFLFASTPDCARQLLAQLRNANPTLTQNERYVQSTKSLPTGGSSYLYADLRGLFEPLYTTARQTWPERGENTLVDLKKLPATPTIAKHLFPFVSATVEEPRQETTVSFSPFGKALTLVAGIGGAIWVSDVFGPTGLSQ